MAHFSDHFPARGWKRRFSLWRRSNVPGLFRSFPRKGMETTCPCNILIAVHSASFPIISPQGDGNCRPVRTLYGRSRFHPFSDHFPARGWKQHQYLHKGDDRGSFSDHFPARGWKRHLPDSGSARGTYPLFRSFPRKGMETRLTTS